MSWCISVYMYCVSTQIMYQTVSIFVTRIGCITEQWTGVSAYIFICVSTWKLNKYVCILSIERSRVSLHFKYEAEGLCSQPTWKINKMCVYFKYRAFVCFPFNFSWSVVSSAYFENNNEYQTAELSRRGNAECWLECWFCKIISNKPAYTASPHFNEYVRYTQINTV